ncbi:NACHT domain-containing protein [Pseudanabaena yagii]|uniref:NACHT domain-containing protein n=1 Tax=Pseudanabaena yagii GIHE-NHR1 TaxID=2722753 RepID=A0ABX1LZ70_9CYAN|nr:NACHT domain-containing protein [Pseudanabaena yagii]NMF60820.1 NACHT domain-containing protein [Pseudanabaena yagii GIHE-NHR1]
MSKEQPQESEQGIEIDKAELTNSPIGQSGENLAIGDHNTFVKYILNLAGLAQPEKVAGRDEAETFLLGEVKTEVRSRLKHSLHREVAITLDKEMQLDRVRTWGVSVKIGMRVIEQIENGTSILNVFQREEVAGRLLILGKPGAGKTTTYLELANDLLEIAESDVKQPIPILFNLSSWKDDDQSIADWVVAEAKSKYGVAIEVAQNLLKRKRLLPMLDSLDELEPHRQEPCVLAINQWMQSEHRPRYLVICSRSEEYDSYSANFQLNAAIYLQPLSDEQLAEYFQVISQPDLWQKLQQDADLLEILRTPLFLSITLLARQKISITEWEQLATTNERKTYLLSAYVRQMLARDIENQYYKAKPMPTSAQTRHWLSWLAQQLQQESKDEFLIEGLQSSNLENRTQQKIYNWIVGVLVGLLFGLIFGLLFGLLFGLILGLILGLLFGLTQKRIEPVETFEFSLAPAKIREFFQSLIKGLISGLIVGLTVKISGQSWGLVLGLFLGLVGLIGGLIDGLKADFVSRKHPNQGIFASLQNSIWITLFTIPISSFGMFFILQVSGKQASILSNLIVGIDLAIFMGFHWSGVEALKHFILRCLLYRNGSIPWNYAQFLNYSTERMLLQRVGGRYRFIHRLLQEHFAAQITDK